MRLLLGVNVIIIIVIKHRWISHALPSSGSPIKKKNPRQDSQNQEKKELLSGLIFAN